MVKNTLFIKKIYKYWQKIEINLIKIGFNFLKMKMKLYLKKVFYSWSVLKIE